MLQFTAQYLFMPVCNAAIVLLSVLFNYLVFPVLKYTLFSIPSVVIWLFSTILRALTDLFIVTGLFCVLAGVGFIKARRVLRENEG